MIKQMQRAIFNYFISQKTKKLFLASSWVVLGPTLTHFSLFHYHAENLSPFSFSQLTRSFWHGGFHQFVGLVLNMNLIMTQLATEKLFYK